MQLKRLVERALREDIGGGDVTTELIIPPNSKGRAVIKAKESGILAGGEVAQVVFTTLDPDINFTQLIKDGKKFARGVVLFELEGKLSTILKGERVALNFLQRLSGIATLTNKFVERVSGTGVKILDTRKTTPGLRELEKYAVRCGGGENHRMGLSDMILIKDNHIKAVGGIREAIAQVIRHKPQGKVEVEVKNLEELEIVLDYPVDRIMLDNMSIDEIKEAVASCEMQDAKCKIEVSGGVSLDNVCEIAETGVDYISVGALTHSVSSIDMSLMVL